MTTRMKMRMRNGRMRLRDEDHENDDDDDDEDDIGGVASDMLIASHRIRHCVTQVTSSNTAFDRLRYAPEILT